MKSRWIILLPLLLALSSSRTYAQQGKYGTMFPDSVDVKVHPSYNRVGRLHRRLFGENYRREWATMVRLPLINIHTIGGGLSPQRYGGGMETKSIRMIDKTGHEWVIRSIEKDPEKLVPEKLRGTFVLDWFGDEYSEQHPFSALCVPPLAEAAGVPHANPVIGVLVADPVLETFGRDYADHVVLLEEREPAGHSENTFGVLKKLAADNENRIDKLEFLRARMLDLLIGDWDRHEDQWRWIAVKRGQHTIYTAVPRDRDQVFHTRQGVFPSIAALQWLAPQIDNFDGTIPRVKYSLFKTRFIQQYACSQFSYEEWMKAAADFTKAETDRVLKDALRRLPKEVYAIRHDELLASLKERRDSIPRAMSEYYYFINRIVDIRASDLDEKVLITDTANGGLHIKIQKSAKKASDNETIMDMVYRPEITKEIRLYVGGGNDQVIIANNTSPVKLRIIGSTGEKTYTLDHTVKPVAIYGRKDSIKFWGNKGGWQSHLANDTAHTHFVAADPYNVWIPAANGSLNKDDGFLLGLGFRYVGHDGFRKLPYSTVQEFMLTHSFETDAFRIDYNGQWIQAIGKADITLAALIDAPDNTMNFFGQGNSTIFNKSGDYHRYYRTRFDYYQIDPALRWHTGKGSTLSIGPSLAYYNFDTKGNTGRAVNQPGLISSYDSTSFSKDKVHLGLVARLISDKQDNKILPVSGYYLNVKLQYYAGLSNDSRSFSQLTPEFIYYQKIDSGARLVLSDRVGGGVSLGNPAFYQSLFLGGQGNLLGYLQNRFSGKQMAYNNLQARFRIANVGGYILPGQLGVTAFYDVGRVWVPGENSGLWHQGAGGGVYFAPATLTVIQVIAGHSSEGWYPYIAFNFRL